MISSQFTQVAKNELSELVAERIELQRRLDELNSRIMGIKMAIGEENILDREMAVLLSSPRKTKRFPKGRKVNTIVSILQESYPDALSLDEIVEKSSDRGVSLLRPSLRSQLSKLCSKGDLVNEDGFYRINPKQSLSSVDSS